MTPDRITAEARTVYEDISDKRDACGCDACIRSAGDIIATALLAAEQRGSEMERAACLKIADEATLECEWTDGVVEASKIAAAIRSRTTEG